MDQDTVGPDPLDGRLRHACLIDALADDLQALLDRRVHPVPQPRFGQANQNRLGVGVHFDIRRSGGKRRAADAHGQFPQQREGALPLLGVGYRG